MTILSDARRGARSGAVLAAAIAAFGLTAGCGGGDGGDGARGGLGADQRRRADQLVSVFENGTTRIQYAYAENLGDGRGVTAGRAGFTTGDGDALEVVRAYTKRVPDNPLARFVPGLEREARGTGGKGSGGSGAPFPDAEFIGAWKRAAADPAFRDVQDAQVDERYFTPAARAAEKAGLRSPLALAELYDASIQHGNGPDRDGLPALVKRTTAEAGPPSTAGEKAWLDAFFDIRVDDLTHPANPDTAEEWRKSVDRVEALRRLAKSGNHDLDGPFEVTAFGSTHTIK